MFRRIRDRPGDSVPPQDGNTKRDVEAGPGGIDDSLARAWFEKRKEQLESQNSTNQTAATAVDVDTASPWNSNDTSNQNSGQIHHHIINNDNDSLLEGASAQSILTDRTPVVSNQRPGFKRARTERSLLPSLASVITNNNNGELSCGDVFDISKWHGKVLYALIILLFLSVVTVVATAVLSRRGGPREPIAIDTSSIATPTLVPTIPLTVAPVATVTLTFTPPRSPTSADVIPIAAPTAAPVGTNPTEQPTQPPTISLSSLVESLSETYRVPANSRTAALSGNGKVLAIVHAQVGGPQNVTVYEWTTFANTWSFRSAHDVGETAAVALSYDGAVMAISAPFESVPGDGEEMLERAGRVQVFLYDFAVTYRPLGQELHGMTTGGFFGHSLALSFTGLTIAIGAPLFVASTESLLGQVQVYDFSTTQNMWVPVGSPLQGMETEDWFGSSISIGQDPPNQGFSFSVRPVTVAVSAPHSRDTGGYVHVYQFMGQEWQMLGRDRDIANKDVDPTLPYDFEDEFGASLLSLVPTNETYRLVVGCPRKDADAKTEDSGMVVVYEYNNYDTRWDLLGAPIVSSTPNTRLGQSGTLLEQGNMLVVGEPGANNAQGLVRFYAFDGTDFSTGNDAEVVIEGTAEYVEFGKSVDAARRDGRLVVAAVAPSGNYAQVLEEPA